MTAPIQIRECDAVLDYLYGLLDGAAKARYEGHLASCAACQAELESLGRVREVARATLPMTPPGERLEGALHAQLMHAAAQRQPRNTGKVLPFLRRVISHPGYAAAAGLLIVGGAVGIQWSRGTLVMPAAKPAETAPMAEVSAPVAAAPAPPVAKPSAPEAEPAMVPLGGMLAEPEKQKLALAQRSMEKYSRDGDLDRTGTGGGSTRDKQAERERAADRRQNDAPARAFEDGLRPKRIAREQGGEAKVEGFGARTSGVKGRGEAAAGVGSLGPAKDKAPADPPPPREPVQQQAMHPNKKEASIEAAPAPPAAVAPAVTDEAKQKPTSGYKAPQEEARPTAPPARSAPSPKVANQRSGEDLDDLVMKAQPTPRNDSGHAASAQDGKADSANANANANTDPIDNERRRAASLAQAGRCAEATAVYDALDHKTPERLNAQDRLTYSRCLRTLGRLEPAQNELDQLRTNQAQRGAMPGAVLKAEQHALDVERKRRASRPAVSGKAGKATRAPADSNSTPPTNNNAGESAK